MMTYNDFLDLAKYANEAWKGSYTDDEVMENAQIYYDEYKALGCASEIITFLLDELMQDDTPEADEYIKKIIDNDKNRREHACKCTKCTNNDSIKMRPTADGFLYGICPTCGAEYLKSSIDTRSNK